MNADTPDDARGAEPPVAFPPAAGSSIDSLLAGPLIDTVGRPPVSCRPDTPIRTVLETMSSERIGSVVVVDARDSPVGIFTFPDLLDRVALRGADLAAEISTAMSTELWTLPSQAPVLDAVMLMARQGIRHVPLVDEGKLVGLVSESRLFSITRGGLSETRAAIRAARDVEDLRRACEAVRSLASRLFDQGLGAEATTRLLSAFNDATAQRLLELLDAHHDFDSGRACWIALGSEGRGEQTLVTDQDNAAILADDADDTTRARVLAVGARANEALDACGFPSCAGGIMAGNPLWSMPYAQWQSRFSDWIQRGTPEDLLNATVFFDFRAVHGAAPLGAKLRDWLAAYAAENSRFLLLMTMNAMQNQPPLGLVRDFVVPASGEHPHTVDLKVNGVQPFVEAARIYALACGASGTGTVERLRAAARARRLGEREVESWIESFRFVQRLRLAANVAQRKRGETLHNHLDPDSLNELDRRILKESFRQARKLQSRLARDFDIGTGSFGV